MRLFLLERHEQCIFPILSTRMYGHSCGLVHCHIVIDSTFYSNGNSLREHRRLMSMHTMHNHIPSSQNSSIVLFLSARRRRRRRRSFWIAAAVLLSCIRRRGLFPIPPRTQSPTLDRFSIIFLRSNRELLHEHLQQRLPFPSPLHSRREIEIIRRHETFPHTICLRIYIFSSSSSIIIIIIISFFVSLLFCSLLHHLLHHHIPSPGFRCPILIRAPSPLLLPLGRFPACVD